MKSMNTPARILTAFVATAALAAVTTADARHASFRARGANGVVAGSAGPKCGVIRGRGAVQNLSLIHI